MNQERSPKSLQRYQSALQLMNNLEQEPAHVMQVARITMMLFDELAPLHNMGATERDMLECAALLHDIGYTLGARHHHRHAFTLITSAPLEGWNKRQKIIIGNIARYHRKSHPNRKHTEYSLLPVWDRFRVLKLATLLQLADGLDRSHSDAIKSLRCKIGIKTVKLRLKVRGEIPQEIEGFKKKRDLFIRIFKRNIVIHKIKNIWHIESHHFTPVLLEDNEIDG